MTIVGADLGVNRDGRDSMWRAFASTESESEEGTFASGFRASSSPDRDIELDRDDERGGGEGKGGGIPKTSLAELSDLLYRWTLVRALDRDTRVGADGDAKGE